MKYINVAIIILCVVIIAQLESINSTVRNAYIVKNADILVQLSKNTPWDALPIFLKEKIALKSAPTKFSKKDLEDVVTYYQKLELTYTEPVSIVREEKNNEQAK